MGHYHYFIALLIGILAVLWTTIPFMNVNVSASATIVPFAMRHVYVDSERERSSTAESSGSSISPTKNEAPSVPTTTTPATTTISGLSISDVLQLLIVCFSLVAIGVGLTLKVVHTFVTGNKAPEAAKAAAAPVPVQALESQPSAPVQQEQPPQRYPKKPLPPTANNRRKPTLLLATAPPSESRTVSPQGHQRHQEHSLSGYRAQQPHPPRRSPEPPMLPNTSRLARSSSDAQLQQLRQLRQNSSPLTIASSFAAAVSESSIDASSPHCYQRPPLSPSCTSYDLARQSTSSFVDGGGIPGRVDDGITIRPTVGHRVEAQFHTKSIDLGVLILYDTDDSSTTSDAKVEQEVLDVSSDVSIIVVLMNASSRTKKKGKEHSGKVAKLLRAAAAAATNSEDDTSRFVILEPFNYSVDAAKPIVTLLVRKDRLHLSAQQCQATQLSTAFLIDRLLGTPDSDDQSTLHPNTQPTPQSDDKATQCVIGTSYHDERSVQTDAESSFVQDIVLVCFDNAPYIMFGFNESRMVHANTTVVCLLPELPEGNAAGRNVQGSSATTRQRGIYAFVSDPTNFNVSSTRVVQTGVVACTLQRNWLVISSPSTT